MIKPVLPADMLDTKTKYHINPTGRFVIGGPMGDAGLTGRKIIVDTYGGYSRHGGGALLRQGSNEGRSLRLLHGALRREEHRRRRPRHAKCEVQLAYAIGVAEPVSVMADTFGTGTIPEFADHRTDSRESSS